MSIHYKECEGQEIQPYIEDLAKLRITVFREFPYLYDGDMEYERKYLNTYAKSGNSYFVIALDGEEVVGAATGIPMADETPEFKSPFERAGYDPKAIFYFGESVLLKEYRGQGIGVEFFNYREKHARRSIGFDYCCFCAVERADDHPQKPAEYTSLDQFWNNRGYAKEPKLSTEYRWKDVGEGVETSKPMTFWLKKL